MPGEEPEHVERAWHLAQARGFDYLTALAIVLALEERRGTN